MISPQREPKVDYVQAPGGNLHYLEWQSRGPQMHMLHGTGFCAGTYIPLIERFAGQMHVFASDLRGHGNSMASLRLPIGHWRVFADDLKLVIETAMTPPIIGVGHSMGAVCTYIAAALYPHLFSAIVMIDPVMLPRCKLWSLALLRRLGLTGKIPLVSGARRRRKVFSGKRQAFKRFTNGRGIFKSWSPEFIQAYIDCGLLETGRHGTILKCDPELEAHIYASVPLDLWHFAPKINCPLLVIRGQHSDVFKPESAARLKRLIPGCQIETIADAGHFVPMEHPSSCTRLIVNFVAQHPKPIPSAPVL